MVYGCMLNIGGDMLEKILQVKGVGLFHDVNGGRHKLQKASIIYADNGQGKSTLVSVFRSCSTNNPELLLKRRTIDGSYDPEVELLFSDGEHAKFENGCWDMKRPEILVFDADFVEQNVYAGGEVTAGQRKKLLEFALGEHAVEAQQKYDNADQDATTAADVVAKTKSQLSDIHKGLTLENFENIAQAPNADDQIATLNKNINEAQNIDSIQSKPLPLQLVAPTLNIESFFDILGKSLDDIDAAAEQQVKDHLDTHNKPQLEKWISDGHAYGEEKNCLFCNQPLERVQLIQAYRSYFNQKYKQLKSDVDQLAGLIAKICSNEIIYKLEAQLDAAIACINGWQKDIATPTFDKNAARNALANIQSLLEKLKQSKEAKLLDGVGSEDDKKQIVKEWQTILDIVDACNKSISNATEVIIDYKDNLVKLNIENLRQQIRNLEMAKTRYRPEVLKLLAQIKTELVQEKDAKKNKKEKKDELNKIVKATLDCYKDSINDLLENFGAQFRIPNIDFHYHGGLRSDYTLQMRGEKIDLIGGTPDFKTSLSEGDKRTLAFAFFIASVESDSDLDNKIIVIDDPMCSLDINRRDETCKVLKRVHDKCKQMIVLAHDMHFLHKFFDMLYDDPESNIKCLRLKTITNHYSDFEIINIEQECEDEYFRCHRVLHEYTEGKATLSSREVAKLIRPMLEGYLHSRFPNLISDKSSFGNMIDQINNSQDLSPLFNARKIVDELHDINCYAKPFHHSKQTQIIESVLLRFVERALAVVYAGEVISPKT